MRKTASPAKGQQPAMINMMEPHQDSMQATAVQEDNRVLQMMEEAFPMERRVQPSLPSHKSRGYGLIPTKPATR